MITWLCCTWATPIITSETAQLPCCFRVYSQTQGTWANGSSWRVKMVQKNCKKSQTTTWDIKIPENHGKTTNLNWWSLDFWTINSITSNSFSSISFTLDLPPPPRMQSSRHHQDDITSFYDRECLSSWWFQPIWKILIKLDHLCRLGNMFETTT